MSNQLVACSYNIHKGFNSGNRKFTLNQMKAALGSLDADLIFLQEVQGENRVHSKRLKDWPLESQHDYLAGEIWPHRVYGKNAIYAAGHHGNAILSKYPIEFWENIDISTNSVERRGLLHAQVSLPRETMNSIHVICLHLGLLEGDRVEQVSRLVTRVLSHVPPDAPLIVGGDFNDWRSTLTEALRRRLNLTEVFEQINGAHARTYPVWFPTLRLDRIYCRGLKVKEARCLKTAPWHQLSDHAPLLAQLAFD